MKKAVKKTKVAVKKVAKKVVKKKVAKVGAEAVVVPFDIVLCHGCHGRGLINAETLCTECDGSGKA